MTYNSDIDRIHSRQNLLNDISEDDQDDLSDEFAALDDAASEFGIDVLDLYDNQNIPEGK